MSAWAPLERFRTTGGPRPGDGRMAGPWRGHRAALVAPTLSVVLALTGCGDPDGGAEPSGGPDWAASADPVATDTLAWAADGVIHLGDASLDAGAPIEAYVVAGDGAYVVSEGSTQLLLVRAGGAEETGAHADPDSLRASPDGRYLAFLDPEAGERDRYDTPQVVTVVVDLSSGREVLRSTEGMGDLASDDLADLYEDATPGVLGVSDEVAWVRATSRVLAVDLATGKVTDQPDEDPSDPTTQPWDAPRYPDSGPWNADRTWAIDQAETRDRFISADGGTVEPSPGTPTWSLSRWLDATTAVGFAVDAPADDGYLDQQAARTLMTCTVPDAACTLVAGTGGPLGRVLLPQRGLL